MTELFTIWKSNIPNFENIQDNTFLLDSKNNTFIHETVIFHLKQKGIIFDETQHYIEFGMQCESHKMGIEYNRKTKLSPILTIFIFENVNNPIILTEVDIESYKYKEIKSENTFYCIFPERGDQLVFDSSKYYGFYNIDNANRFLKINVQTKKNDQLEIYSLNENYIKTDCMITQKEVTIIEKTVAYKNIISILLYDEDKKIDILDKILFENPKGIIKIHNTNRNYFDIEYLEDNFGEVAQDLYPFINKDLEFYDVSGNRFVNNKIIQNILSKDVCYWIINESEKNEWTTSNYSNYPTYLSIDKMPSILNFLLFVSNFWLIEIKKIYNCQTINFNIVDMFIAKYKQEKIDEVKKRDEHFICLNIVLNDNIDYKDGEILFDDINEKIMIHQGDMLIYTGSKNRTKGSVSDGVKYVLVLLIDIII